MKNLQLSLSAKPHHYQIQIGEGTLSSPSNFKDLPFAHKVVIITNKSLAPLYLDSLKHSLQTANPQLTIIDFVLEDGESYKSFDSFQKIQSFLLQEQLKRNDGLIALGGGVIGDITGFCAATYQRGIAFVQIPTSLLAMVDSSIGGKTAINHPLGKNMIGAFHQPHKVVIDIHCLRSLPRREFAAGMAEIVKAAIIDSTDFFNWLESNVEDIKSFNPDFLIKMIEQACVIKAKIVQQDETEQGVRALLNLGHSFGHAIEKTLGYGQMLHGEAVAIGMVLASRLSQKLNLLTAAQAERVSQLLAAFELPIRLPKDLDVNAMVAAMGLDKKNLSKNPRLILPKKIGQVMISEKTSYRELADFLSQQ
ncbi:3-dehydroquinate synthase [Kangiella sp. TOML190]|uniref:3-dehydroquinate synthase n=1 Tax=Kangiella sp. TOML190 TaxID=2931351 RepID=UPI00203E8B54|nr:3-dehydroquinate synthase [Kangiella sp. TOML190]